MTSLLTFPSGELERRVWLFPLPLVSV